MKFLARLRSLLPGCEAEKLLEKNAKLSNELRGEFADTVGSLTTILNEKCIADVDRRKDPDKTIPGDRRARHLHLRYSKA